MRIGIYQMTDGFTFVSKQDESLAGRYLYAPFASAFEIATFRTENLLEKSDEEILRIYLNPSTQRHNQLIEKDNIISSRVIDFKDLPKWKK